MRLLGSSHAPCDEAGVSSPPGSGQPVQVRCGAMHAYVGRISRHHEVMTPHKGDCELLLSNEMEDRRFLRKPLQPARPIRRTLPDTGTKFMVNIQAKFTDNYRDSNCNLLCAIGNNHHVFKDLVPEKPTEEPSVNTNKDRITYSRDLLLQLSNLSVSKQKPKYLPDLPIIRQHPVFSGEVTSDNKITSLSIRIRVPASVASPTSSCQITCKTQIQLPDRTITPIICQTMTR
ncbi:uncharacterized protein C8orf88 homolog isoform X8 [Engystomops pustulosus]|uniref:uncharacterized protein C8orf88 homolog isoform X8 n=1 Tax=Engystomops pustulosus TaxID=76066 RepID=UPI003AFA4A35